jgi:hypothetical protein
VPLDGFFTAFRMTNGGGVSLLVRALGQREGAFTAGVDACRYATNPEMFTFSDLTYCGTSVILSAERV